MILDETRLFFVILDETRLFFVILDETRLFFAILDETRLFFVVFDWDLSIFCDLSHNKDSSLNTSGRKRKMRGILLAKEK